MASKFTRRDSWFVVTPLVAITALGLTACSNSVEPSDVPGTTPQVWTGAPAPLGEQAAGGSEHAAVDTISVDLDNPQGSQIGTATLAESEEGYVQVTVNVDGLTPGFHGFHVHSVGKCEPNSVAPTGGEPGNFLSAGGHFQVGGRTGHPASGDLTSLQVREDGVGYLVTTTDSFTLEDLRNDGQGTALMIHADPDNFGNIPSRYTLPNNATSPDEETLSTGDAGARVACGVIEG
ncbi:superoxide dismutase[Cu-Zn] [Rhodococcus xishaensis]|uniref:Superoxide dismutase [Cu-Zn] n=1 Tax=Rhodococcus xishaensis TaxID=2487364 RepID=A0A3S3ACF2_9NOCA|nr:superoxide dismutase family protein [Rhodococcus xishaensis]RVW01243.1 superoxide dismutase family protein [Rhodococcus xishaensis]